MAAFSQRDPRWANDQLGSSSHTIAQAGCLITAAASMLTDFGVPIDPGRLNRWLRSHNGYADDCLFRFTSVSLLGADPVAWLRYEKDAVARPLTTGDGALAELTPELSRTTGTRPERHHWIRLLSHFYHEDGAGDWNIMDPWQLPGHELTTLTEAWEYWKLGRVAIYQPNAAHLLTATYLANGPVQTALAMYPTPDAESRWDPNP
jgi:hypothetical protein